MESSLDHLIEYEDEGKHYCYVRANDNSSIALTLRAKES